MFSNVDQEIGDFVKEKAYQCFNDQSTLTKPVHKVIVHLKIFFEILSSSLWFLRVLKVFTSSYEESVLLLSKRFNALNQFYSF